ncbi:hypothetical protein [Demequina zhanjiangensis]|uniref:Uncharacterized protein n=1 Tax=Demequina zhanjiangensis TaxID=3051659 RepID=A0ABT8G2Q0_9MICO|nr:hypothetical protein [Demequina sp. SYSU T00b26]MDN4473352.1 hypothetical protein [Demequina sp. SYSU T00b26]
MSRTGILQRLRGASDRDSGAALVMTLMIMSVGAIVITTLVSVTIFNTAFSAKSRADMRVLASADAGIDMVMGLLEGKKYSELPTVCGPLTFVINDDDVTVTTAYDIVGLADPVSCPSATQIASGVTLQSTAVSGNVPVANETVSKTVEAVLLATPEEMPLDKAIFSEASTEITSNTTVSESTSGASDAHVYTNGGFTCNTQETIEGSLYAAHGDVEFVNDCNIQLDVWASGTIFFKAGTFVNGDIYSASTASTAIELVHSNSEVTGSVIANGGIEVATAVGGNVVSLAGAVTLNDKSEITRNVHSALTLSMLASARTDGNAASNTEITTNARRANVVGVATAPVIANDLNAGSKVIGTAPRPSIAGLPAPLGYPTEVVAPPREEFPYFTMNEEDILLWQADGYKVNILDASACSTPAALNAINAADYGDEGKALVIFDECTTPVYFAQHSDLVVHGDLGLVSKSGFHIDNQVDIVTDAPDRPELVWMVPADAPNVTWVSAGEASQITPICTPQSSRYTSTGISQDLYFQKFKVVGVDMLAYTPCSFQQDTGWDSQSDPWTGQLYAGNVQLHNSFDLKMSMIGVPSNTNATPNENDTPDFQLISRYDLFG